MRSGRSRTPEVLRRRSLRQEVARRAGEVTGADKPRPGIGYGRDHQGFHALARGRHEAAAALIIGLATIEAVLSALLLFVPGAASHISGEGPQAAKEQVRFKLGRWLAVALEFELGADILRTAVAPT